MARKQKEERDEVYDAAEEGSNEPRVYELGFHIDPELSQKEVKGVFQSIKSIAEEIGEVIAVGEPEKISLAYTISRMEHEGRHDFPEAFFAWVVYETGARTHERVLEAANAELRIFRFIDVLTTKDAALHAAQQQEMRKHATTKAETQAEPKVPEASVSEEQLETAIGEATT